MTTPATTASTGREEVANYLWQALDHGGRRQSSMDSRFAEVVASLHPSFERLRTMEPFTCSTLPKTMPVSGIYLLSEGDRHLYVGRSRNIRGRLGRHSRPRATHRMAAFAFRLAREATGHLRPSYRSEGSRSALMTEVAFQTAFLEAKDRIRRMQVRFVEERDPVRQTILEVYVAVTLQTPYNDFDTH